MDEDEAVTVDAVDELGVDAVLSVEEPVTVRFVHDGARVGTGVGHVVLPFSYSSQPGGHIIYSV
jgi:hypothetical protein